MFSKDKPQKLLLLFLLRQHSSPWVLYLHFYIFFLLFFIFFFLFIHFHLFPSICPFISFPVICQFLLFACRSTLKHWEEFRMRWDKWVRIISVFYSLWEITFCLEEKECLRPVSCSEKQIDRLITLINRTNRLIADK